VEISGQRSEVNFQWPYFRIRVHPCPPAVLAPVVAGPWLNSYFLILGFQLSEFQLFILVVQAWMFDVELGLPGSDLTVRTFLGK
jgi:hypothetical protein